MVGQVQQVKSGYKQTEIGVIPEDWEVKHLDSLVKFRNGVAHEDIVSESGKFILINSKFVSTQGVISKNCLKNLSPVFANELVMVMSDVPNGKAIARCFYIDSDNKYSLNQRICALNSTNIFSKYLYYVLDRNKFYLSFDDGVKQTNLRRQEVLKCPIRLPKNPKEQIAIANILSEVDLFLEKLKKLIIKKKNIKQGVMRELLTNKKRLPGFTNIWKKKSLREITKINRGQLITSSTLVQGDVPVIAGGKKPAYYHNKPNRTKRSITISASGANAGYIAFHDYPFFASDCSTIDENPNFSILYMYYLLSMNQNKIYFLQTGGAQPHIHPSDLYPLIFNLPKDSKEQTAISNILSDMDEDIKELEQKKDKYLMLKQGMMQELLTGRTRVNVTN